MIEKKATEIKMKNNNEKYIRQYYEFMVKCTVNTEAGVLGFREVIQVHNSLSKRILG